MHPATLQQIAEYKRQILSPDYAGFEAFYGCTVPPELRRFYELGEKLLAGVLYANMRYAEQIVRVEFIQHANPMTKTNWEHRYGREYFRFATNTDGYPLLIMPAVTQSLVFGDWSDSDPMPNIDDLGCTLWEIIDSLGTNP